MAFSTKDSDLAPLSPDEVQRALRLESAGASLSEGVLSSATIWKRVTQVLSLARLKPFDTTTESGRSMERYRRAALTALASAFAKGVAILTGLVTVPLCVHYLGTERYGLWMTVSSVIAMLTFADLGLGSGLMNAISDADGRNDADSARTYVSSAFFMLASISLALLACFALIYPHISWPHVFNVSSPQAIAEAGPATAVLFACFAFDISLGVIQRIQLGYQEGFVNSAWGAVASLFGLGGILTVIHLKAGLPWLVLAMSSAAFLANIFNGILLFRFRRPWLLPKLRAVTREACRKILRVGVLFFVLQIAGSLFFASDNFVAAQILGASSVTQYSVPMKLFNMVPMLASMVVGPLWPAYAEALARRDIPWAKRTLARSVLLTFVVVASASALLVMFGRPLIRLWVGPEVKPSFSLLAGLGLWAVLTATGGAVAMFWNGANVVGFQVVTATLIAGSSIATKIALTRRVGVAGVVWGNIIAYSTFAIIPTVIYLPRVLAKLEKQARVAS